MDRLRLLLVASLVTVSPGCATWEDNRDASGAGKPDAEVAIFKAHQADTRRIVSASDGRIEYQYNPAQKQPLRPAAHQRIRLLPGQYTITAKTWPFGSLYEFEVDLEAGHTYKVETFLCNFECRGKGKPYRHDRWIQDLTTHERISSVESECYLAKPRGAERRRVPCPAKEDDHDSGGAGKANAEVAIFKAHLPNTRRIVSASDGRIAYQHNPEMKATQRSDPHSLIQLLPGQYTIMTKTWPFGSLYEFEVDLKAGHIYGVETDLCSWECISTSEPYRHDRWIQDLTEGERISTVVSECYLGKKRQRERQKVPCPDG